jgi:hypothetical protein
MVATERGTFHWQTVESAREEAEDDGSDNTPD